MKRLPDLPLELKALATAILIYRGLAVLMGFTYIVASHQGAGNSYWIEPSDIAALYTGPGVGMVTLISLAHIHLLGLLRRILDHRLHLRSFDAWARLEDILVGASLSWPFSSTYRDGS